MDSNRKSMTQSTSQTKDCVHTDGPIPVRNDSQRRGKITKAIKLFESRNSNLNSNNRNQLFSFILFLGAIIVINLCPFEANFEPKNCPVELNLVSVGNQNGMAENSSRNCLIGPIETCVRFMGLMFTNPVQLGMRTTRFIRAEANSLARMRRRRQSNPSLADMYQHQQALMYHRKSMAMAATRHRIMMQAMMMQRRGKRQHYGYFPSPEAYMYNHHDHHQQAPMYPRGAAAANQIINHYTPSPPTYVDHAEGLYGQYNNAYGRQDGGYHLVV